MRSENTLSKLTLQELESHFWKSVDSSDYKNYIFGKDSD